MSAMDRLTVLNAPARLRSHDASLFSADVLVQVEVDGNLGWTHLAHDAAEVLPRLTALAAEVACEGLTDVVLLGMGGSSLAALVIGEVLAPDGAGPRLHVLDTTSPATVSAVLDEIDIATTIFLLSSKSGTTIEPLSLFAIFWEAAEALLGPENAGSRFIATTDAGTPLEALAAEKGFRDVVSAPSTVGGRYSALSVFGLLPAALLGVDVDAFVERSVAMEEACDLPAAENPGALLATFAVEAQAVGRDKLTVISSPGLESFGLWVEQLVAESLGKEGTGILPVVELNPDKPFGYGRDRALAIVRFESDARLAGWAEEWRAHFPVTELVLRDAYDLGAEFVRWEHAVALMGPLLGVNPFGQPNVAAAKAATAAVLDGSLAVPDPQASAGDTSLTFAGALPTPGHAETTLGTAIGHAVASLAAGGFLGVLAYLPGDEALLAPLTAIVPPVSAELGVPVTLEIGPRYLHSTGQFHKGGPNTGVFLLVTSQDAADLDVPGSEGGLRALYRAQAEGDLVTLAENDRRVLRLDLPDSSPESIAKLVRGLADAAGVVFEE